jgi:hypothetical protein
MEHWRYAKMPFEPSLQEYEYFVSIDADAFVTADWQQDPFEVMHAHKLLGAYSIESYWTDAASIAEVQRIVDRLFPVSERQRRYIDYPHNLVFDEDGNWGPMGIGVWGCFFGGRMDFFRAAKYRQLVDAIVRSGITYIHRFDEQNVFGLAYALLSNGSDVWALPNHQVDLHILHNSWLDRKAVYYKGNGKQLLGSAVLTRWKDFHEPESATVNYVDYMNAKHSNFDFNECGSDGG